MKKIIISIIALFLIACSSKKVIIEDSSLGAENRKFSVNGKTVVGDVVYKGELDVQPLQVAKRTETQDLILARNENASLGADEAVQKGLVIYFDYDSYDLDQASIEKINNHATQMQQNRGIKLRLEGHTDERGSRDYNLALSENRALAVKNVLALYDLSNRIDVVGYGEEKPVDDGHNETAWQKNRRVELIFY